MKKCRKCKSWRRELAALRTEKECLDVLVSRYDLEVKQLEAQLDQALDVLDVLTKVLKKIADEPKEENENG